MSRACPERLCKIRRSQYVLARPSVAAIRTCFQGPAAQGQTRIQVLHQRGLIALQLFPPACECREYRAGICVAAPDGGIWPATLEDSRRNLSARTAPATPSIRPDF